MTAEIAIMNKSGVALAADSAVTISGSDMAEKKVYNSANKLFALSKSHPVGIMVFNNAQFMGTPWETIIKLFRKEVDESGYDTLNDYVEKFFEFLLNFDLDEQKNFYLKRYLLNLGMMLNGTKKAISSKDDVPRTEIELVRAAIDDIQSSIEVWIPPVRLDQAVNAYKELYEEKVRSFLNPEWKDLRDDEKTIFEELFEFYTKFSVILALQGDESTGIVFSGFGNKEIFPSTIEYRVGVSLFDTIERTEVLSESITLGNDSSILPFAQSAEVRNFLKGFGSKLETYLGAELQKIMVEKYPNVMVNQLQQQGMLNGSIEPAKTVISSISEGTYKHILEQLTELSNREYAHPVIDAVTHLSIEDLAGMAETFINLESFRKRVTFTSETVGGPIDVAVITKSEGLIWIKRKHYFSPEINNSFFKNYD